MTNKTISLLQSISHALMDNKHLTCDFQIMFDTKEFTQAKSDIKKVELKPDRHVNISDEYIEVQVCGFNFTIYSLSYIQSINNKNKEYER